MVDAPLNSAGGFVVDAPLKSAGGFVVDAPLKSAGGFVVDAPLNQGGRLNNARTEVMLVVCSLRDGNRSHSLTVVVSDLTMDGSSVLVTAFSESDPTRWLSSVWSIMIMLQQTNRVAD